MLEVWNHGIWWQRKIMGGGIARGITVHCKKRLAIFPFPAEMTLTKLSQARIN
jgi:hypothetical protein